MQLWDTRLTLHLLAIKAALFIKVTVILTKSIKNQPEKLIT